MAACRSPGPIDKELARQLQPSMDSTTTVQQFRHHYLRFHSLQKILHAHQPSLLQDSCSTLLQETQAHGNNSRGFFGEDNVSDACSGKDGGLSSLLAMEQALHIHFSGASHDVHCCQADVDHSMNDCGCPTVSLKCHEKKTSFRVRFFWHRLAQESLRLQHFIELSSTEIWMQMVSVSDALSCLHGVSSSAPGKGIWQENIDAGCLISNGCDGEINCRLQDREMQILDVDSNSHHGAANSGIQPLKTAYYASTTEYGQDILALHRFIEQNRRLIATLLSECAADIALGECTPPVREGNASLSLTSEVVENCSVLGDCHSVLSNSTCQYSCSISVTEQGRNCQHCTNFKCEEAMGMGQFHDLICGTLLKGCDFDKLLLTLSQLHSSLSKHIQITDKTSTALRNTSWRPPDSFSRRTLKYWVKPGSLMAVKIAICQHLPILVYNENISSDSTSDSKSNWDCRQGALRTSQAPVQGVKSCISSIYLDDPLSLPNYRRRLGKEDGATVLRVRWYGDEASHRQINSPTASTVFLERKVHRVKAPSTKERVPVLPALLPAVFLPVGVAAPEQLLPTTNTKSDRLELLSNMVEHISAERQEPVARTTYLRTAFQESGSSALRVTIDEDLFVSAESLEALQSRQQWLQQDPSVPIFCFPYGIMEIKVESGSSGKKALMSTVGQLIKAGQLLEVSCFSKYQHAVATLLLPGRQGDHQAPRWFADACESCGNLRPKNFSELSAERRQSENGRKAGQVCDQKGGSGGVAAEVNSGGENAAPAVSATWSWRRPLLSLRPHARPAAEDQGWTLCHGKQARKTTKVRVEPRTFFSNERTFLSWVNIAVLLLFAGLALMDGSSFTGSGPGAPIRLAHPQPGIANPTPTAGASVGADDATLGAERAQVAAHRIPGMLIAPTAVVFMVYALFQYHYRASKLFSREYIRYDDIWGPTCLVIVLLVTSVTAFSLSLKGTTAF